MATRHSAVLMLAIVSAMVIAGFVMLVARLTYLEDLPARSVKLHVKSQLDNHSREDRLVWQSVLEEYGNGMTLLLYGPGEDEVLPVIQENCAGKLSEPIFCDSILYTAHDGKRSLDIELDEYRRRWSALQEGNCFFVLKIQSGKLQTSSQEGSDNWYEALNKGLGVKDWRKRTKNPPQVLVQRYRGALVLMSLIKLNILKVRPKAPIYLGSALDDAGLAVFGSEPWILYVDSDTMMANIYKSIEDLVTRSFLATKVASLEKSACGQGKAISCPEFKADPAHFSKLSLIISLSNSCSQSFFTHSGAFLFRPSLMNGFLFEALFLSPLYKIDTKQFRMGDQAIWDWLIEREFRVNWNQIRTLCRDADMMALFKPTCEDNQFIFTRDIMGSGDSDTHALLLKLEQKWFAPNDSEDTAIRPSDGFSTIAFACVRWFNSPGCLKTNSSDEFFHFRCGDLLWHLYGCDKKSWKRATPLHALLNTPQCSLVLPAPIPLAN